MATGRIPTTANSPLTVKGDLFGYSTTQARVPVGNDGETLVADSSASTGLSYQANFAAGKNKIINGNFANWQRGSTFTGIATDTYFADRWITNWTAGTGSNVFSRQAFTPGTAPVAGYESQYFARAAVTSANGSTQMGMAQRIEDVRTFAGQTATFSFWAKADSSRTATILFQQNFGSGGSADVYSSTSTVSLTTAWTRFSVTYAVPSISGKTVGTSSYFTAFIYYAVGSLSGSANLDLWGAQIENGSTATAFQTATGTIQGELAACQRYYVRWGGAAIYELIGLGIGATSTIGSISVMLPVQMRTAPATVDYSTLGLFDGTGIIGSAVPTIVNQYSGTKVAGIDATVASGVTVNRPYRLTTNNSISGFLGLSAEL
jgi:hypothetical protein